MIRYEDALAWLRAWRAAEQEGAVDDYGGHQYFRVRHDWIVFGCPRPIRHFIFADAENAPRQKGRVCCN